MVLDDSVTPIKHWQCKSPDYLTYIGFSIPTQKIRTMQWKSIRPFTHSPRHGTKTSLCRVSTFISKEPATVVTHHHLRFASRPKQNQPKKNTKNPSGFPKCWRLTHKDRHQTRAAAYSLVNSHPFRICVKVSQAVASGAARSASRSPKRSKGEPSREKDPPTAQSHKIQFFFVSFCGIYGI